MPKHSRGRSKRNKPLRRKVGGLSLKRTFLVFCEGERTEVDYLRALKQEPAVRDIASVDIHIQEGAHGFAPLPLVRTAVEARSRATDETGEVDEVWCIFDVEQPKNHPKLRDAVALARNKNVKVAVSNPCFELWLALHFGEHSRPLKTTEAISLRRTYENRKDKGLDGVRYMPLRDDAARRARDLDDRHKGNGTEFPNNNPSSSMYRFLEAVERPPADAG